MRVAKKREPHQLEPMPGAGLIAGGFACITLALSFSQEWSWMRLLACFLIGLVMLVAAGLVDRRARYPVAVTRRSIKTQLSSKKRPRRVS